MGGRGYTMAFSDQGPGDKTSRGDTSWVGFLHLHHGALRGVCACRSGENTVTLSQGKGERRGWGGVMFHNLEFKR